MKKIEYSLRKQWDTINRQKSTLWESQKEKRQRGGQTQQ